MKTPRNYPQCLPQYWDGPDTDIIVEPRNQSVTLSVFTSLPLPFLQPWHQQPKVSPLDPLVGGTSHLCHLQKGGAPCSPPQESFCSPKPP